jgi:hypothetical protein
MYATVLSGAGIRPTPWTGTWQVVAGPAVNGCLRNLGAARPFLAATQHVSLAGERA